MFFHFRAICQWGPQKLRLNLLSSYCVFTILGSIHTAKHHVWQIKDPVTLSLWATTLSSRSTEYLTPIGVYGGDQHQSIVWSYKWVRSAKRVPMIHCVTLWSLHLEDSYMSILRASEWPRCPTERSCETWPLFVASLDLGLLISTDV